jgi:hypothetical protein
MLHQELFEFVWLPTFERSSKTLLDDEDKQAIERILCERLDAGSVMKRTGGLRKLRYRLRGGGKRGGARIVYLPDEVCERVYMILAYAKGAKDSLTRAQENELRRLVRELLKEPC